jgi:hypothetical protein
LFNKDLSVNVCVFTLRFGDLALRVSQQLRKFYDSKHFTVKPIVQLVRYTNPVRKGTRLYFHTGADHIFTFSLTWSGVSRFGPLGLYTVVSG